MYLKYNNVFRVQTVQFVQVFDKEGNGYLTLEQLKNALTKYGEEFTDKEAEEFFRLI